MHLGWKVLIPANLVWIMAVTTLRVLRARGWATAAVIAVVVGGLLILGLIWMAVDSARLSRLQAEQEAEEAEEAARPRSYPIPPMDLVVPPSPRLVSAGVAPSPLGAGPVSTEPVSDDRGPIDG
jgi:NADH-quinone oxidoreductase subunit H